MDTTVAVGVEGAQGSMELLARASGRHVVVTLGPPNTVVGVVRDVKAHDLLEEPRPILYLPFGPGGDVYLSDVALVVRTSGDPAALAAPLREVLRAAGPDVAIDHVGTLADRLSGLLLPQRLGAALLGFFGALALIVAAVGVYGVVSFSVGRRAREIGVRIALGASPGRVSRLVIGQSLRSVVAGAALGLLLAAAATRTAASFLSGLSPTDLPTFFGTSLFLCAVAALASWVPVRRAVRKDPMHALRSD